MRWFAYVDTNNKWHLNSLFPNEEIKDMIRQVPSNYETFASIQNYDAQGKIQSCPLYIDIDSSSLYDAWEITKDTWRKLAEDFQLNPYIYFSGSKGFHIIVPLLIKHEQCHKIAQEIAEDYCVDLDRSVYTSRRMWRCNGSFHSKTGNYKIKIPEAESMYLLDNVLELSKNGKNEKYIEHDFTYRKNDLFDYLVKEAASKICHTVKLPTVIAPFKELDPCVLRLWELTDHKPGDRHNTLYLLARSCIKSGDSKSQALARFSSHPYWKEYPQFDIDKVVAATYRAKFAHWNCRGSSTDSRLLNEHCVGKTCAWHKDFAWNTTGLNASESHETIPR
jgi:hypothetical protein